MRLCELHSDWSSQRQPGDVEGLFRRPGRTGSVDFVAPSRKTDEKHVLAPCIGEQRQQMKDVVGPQVALGIAGKGHVGEDVTNQSRRRKLPAKLGVRVPAQECSERSADVGRSGRGAVMYGLGLTHVPK